VTELPRGSFPLVVPPPGGFEEAVRRGRSLRRRRAGGSSGAALVLVGALAYSLMGGPNGTTGLQPAKPIHDANGSERPGDPGQSPEPTASPTDVDPTSTAAPDPGSGGDPYVPPVPVPSAGLPERPPGEVSEQAFSRRNPILESDPATSAGTQCLDQAATQKWCTFASVDPQYSDETYYVLKFTACRSVDSNTNGEITFGKKQKVEFVITRVENSENIWTYSRGVAAEATTSKTEMFAGECVDWTTNWDGYDDWGGDPGAGEYRLEAWSTGTSDGPLAHAYSATFTNDV